MGVGLGAVVRGLGQGPGPRLGQGWRARDKTGTGFKGVWPSKFRVPRHLGL